MIITESEMYWLTRLDILDEVFRAMSVVGIIGVFVTGFIMVLGKDEREWFERNKKRLWSLFILAVLYRSFP